MKTLTFAKRCTKEILRDPITLAFGLGFPIVLLLLLSAIQANIPTPLFQIEKLSPGIAVFGLAFITLFSATLIAKDRESAFLHRLYTTPLKPTNFILGYMIPLIPISLFQTIVCYLVALFLGLSFSVNIILSVLTMLPVTVFYISLGLLCGSILNVKQVGGICGALLTNLSAWLSGVWFDLNLVGGAFQKTAKLLPFYHAVELQRDIINGNITTALPHLYVVIFYGIITAVFAVYIFLKQMSKN